LEAQVFVSSTAIWISALGTLAIYSFLYRDNPVYRATEQILVGLSVGYLVVITVRSTLLPRVWSPMLQGDPWSLVAAVWVLLMWSRMIPSVSWLSRLPLALVVGAGAGLSVPAMLKARVLSQMGAMLKPGLNFDLVVGAVGVLTTLAYFHFTRPPSGFFHGAAKVGTWFLMVFFGATFGFTIMSRLSLLLGRTEFLLGTWLGILP
jgi:hypothetical protein